MSRFSSLFKGRAADILLWLPAAAAAAGWLPAAAAAIRAIPFRYAYNYAEPAVAAVVLNIPSDPLLYHNFHAEPFIVNPYTPLFFYLTHAARVIAEAPMAAGRIVSFAAGVIATAAVYRILRALEVRRSIACFFAALFIQIPLAQNQWAVMRPDLTGTALSLCAIACFLVYERRKNSRPIPVLWWAGAAFAVLAVMTKQNFVAGAGCYFLYLISTKRFKDAVKFAAVMALGIGVPLLALDRWTQGNFLLNQLMSVKKSFYPELFTRFWMDFLSGHALLLAAAVGAIFLRGPKGGVGRILVFYLALTGLSTVTLGKIGADTNYFLEFVAAVCLAAGLFLERGLLSGGVGGWRRAGLMTALVILAVCSAAFIRPLKEWDWVPWDRTEAAPHPFDPITELIRRTEGPVLAENNGLLLAAGKPIVYETYEFAQLAYAGVWDERKILDKLDRKEFPLIILETNLWRVARTSRFTPAFIEHFRRNYRPAAIVAGQILCEPIREDGRVK